MRTIAQVKSLAENRPSKYVFPSPKGDGHIENVQKAIQQIKKATGISFVGHDLRVRCGQPDDGDGNCTCLVVGKILNHVEPGVTKVYDRHSYDREKREALETWSKRLIVLVSDLKEVNSESAL